jgi:hypothetical protein
MPRNIQVFSQGMLWFEALKDFLEFKNIVLEVKLSNKFKNGNKNLSMDVNGSETYYLHILKSWGSEIC